MKNSRLVRINYDKEKDEFQLLNSLDGGETWGFVMGTKCQRRAGQDETEEPEFIHCGIIQELRCAIDIGYKLVY